MCKGIFRVASIIEGQSRSARGETLLETYRKHRTLTQRSSVILLELSKLILGPGHNLLLSRFLLAQTAALQASRLFVLCFWWGWTTSQCQLLFNMCAKVFQSMVWRVLCDRGSNLVVFSDMPSSKRLPNRLCKLWFLGSPHNPTFSSSFRLQLFCGCGV